MARTRDRRCLKLPVLLRMNPDDEVRIRILAVHGQKYVMQVSELQILRNVGYAQGEDRLRSGRLAGGGGDSIPMGAHRISLSGSICLYPPDF